MSWKLALLVLVLVLVHPVTGCSATARPIAPREGPSSKAAHAAAPYRLDRQQALAAVRDLGVRGFDRVLTCPTREHEGCQRRGTEDAHWLVGSQARGARLPDGKGLVELVRTIVTAWPTDDAARRYAGWLTGRLQRYRGDYDIPRQATGPGTYAPGDRGRGELHRVSWHGWRGAGLRRMFHYVLHDLSPSAAVPGGHFVLRQGCFVADVEWVARSQATDRHLSRLPRRLLLALR